MKKSAALILCWALVLASGQEISKKATKTAEKPIATIPATTVPPTTTTEPITSTEPPTTPPTTSTTTSTTTTPTTTIPTTTSDNPVTTTVAPPTPKDPETNTWSVNGTDNNLIIVRLATQLVITYGTDNKNWSVPINVPANKNLTNATGTFTQNDETLMLHWKSPKGSENIVSLSFRRDNVSKTYILSRLEASIAADELPNSNLSAPLKLVHSHEHFNTTLGNSYRCVRLQHFNLTKENEKAPIGVAKVTDLRFQAFENKSKGGFGLAEDCAFDTPDVVPIAVGCALAGLVVIVLVAYLVSRRRSQARGYLSM